MTGKSDDLIKTATEGPIKHSVSAVFDTLNRKVESLDLLKIYSRAQKKHIEVSLGNLKLLGMAAPLPLSKIYYPTRVSTTIRRRLYEQEWLNENTQTSSGAIKTGARNNKDVDAYEYVSKTQKVVILGGPGAGKTTFLRFLALLHAECLQRERNEDDSVISNESLLPFFIHLPHFAKTEKDLFNFTTDALVKSTDQHALDFARRIFKSGSALLLLDSFDEVPLNLRADVVNAIKDFEANFPSVRMVLSCRTADYEAVLQNFCEVEISRLSQDAITKIVRAWFDTDHGKAKKLTALIKADSGVAALTETPLLLSLLCIQYRHDLQLPKRKTELYRRCLYALLRDWDADRGFRRETAYESMSDDRKERLFEHVAGRFFIEQEAYEFKKEQLISLVGDFIDRLNMSKDNASGIIDEIERHHGILEQLSQDYYCFSHTSMQDYFTARHLLSRRMELNTIASHLENESWYPVIEFVVALAEEPQGVLDLLVRKSDMRGLSNFPPMARRTKLLMLLYKSMLSAPFISNDLTRKCYDHLVLSQIQMAKIFGAGKVIPFANLEESGVRHLLFHIDRPRPTLADALGPYRKLTNQILASPSEGYANACFSAVDKLQGVAQGSNYYENVLNESLVMNLLMPLAFAWPDEVCVRLDKLIAITKLVFVKRMAEQAKVTMTK